MILPAPKLFKVSRGITFDYPFTYYSGSPTTDPAPYNLTGYSGQWVISWYALNGSAEQTVYTTGVSLGHSGIFLGGTGTQTPTNGIIELYMSEADTASVTWSSATYILEITDPLNNVYQLLEGGIGVIA